MSRPILLSLLALAGVALLAVVLMKRPQSAVTGTQPSGAEIGAAAPSNAAAGKQPAATTAAQVGQENMPFKDELRVMANSSLPLSERQKAAEALAQNGSEAAIAALKRAFTNGSDELRAAIAQSLGKCGSPECAKWLQELLQGPSVLVARGAVRGLAEQNSPEAAGALVRLLNDPNADLDLRAEVALSMGNVDQPGVAQALSEAARSAQDEDFATTALGSLGARDFAETESLLQGLSAGSEPFP